MPNCLLVLLALFCLQTNAQTECESAGRFCSPAGLCPPLEIYQVHSCLGTDECCGTCTTDTDCNDGNLCSENTCDPVSGCVTTPTDCDDGNACTADFCFPSQGCQNFSIDCGGNSNQCTEEVCYPSLGCIEEPVDCDDGNACTLDTCDSATGCSSTPIDCDDGNVCTVNTCDSIAGCVATSVDCDEEVMTNDATNRVKDSDNSLLLGLGLVGSIVIGFIVVIGIYVDRRGTSYASPR